MASGKPFSRLPCWWRLLLALVALSPAPRAPAASPAALAAHLQALAQQLPPARFTVVSQPPFVVIGDEAPAAVRERARVVGWAVARLKQDFFTEDPPEIIDVWLLAHAAGYEQRATQIVGQPPGTPFGFYDRRHQAIVINLSAGAGTLVHELVHPLLRANFPHCPPWFNEGLAALYEQPAERDGQIVGLTNWRLTGLHQLLRSDRVPTIETVSALDAAEFYGQDEAAHYAVARYWCYYLQARGRLVQFYHAFRAHCDTDPTGLQTLQQILQEPQRTRLQLHWELFVRHLTLNESGPAESNHQETP